MTNDAFKEARRLYEKIALYRDKLNSICNMLIDCENTAYSEGEINVSVYNGYGNSHSEYINMTIVKDMLIKVRDHYKALIAQCENDIEAL